MSTLYFETDTGDGFREPGFSKERRLDPQVTIGLLTDASGFPLMVNAFEGNKACLLYTSVSQRVAPSPRSSAPSRWCCGTTTSATNTSGPATQHSR